MTKKVTPMRPVNKAPQANAVSEAEKIAAAARMVMGAQQPTLTPEQIEQIKQAEINARNAENDLATKAKDLIDSNKDKIKKFVHENVGLYLHADELENPMAVGMNPVYKRRVGVATITPAMQNVPAIINAMLDNTENPFTKMDQLDALQQMAGLTILSTVNDVTHIVMTTAFRRDPSILDVSFKISVEEDGEKAALMLKQLDNLYHKAFDENDIVMLYDRFLF